MVKISILEPLGIPRIRLAGISVFNVLGTMLFAYPLTLGLRCFDSLNQIIYFQTACMCLVIAPVVHYLIGDQTPLVKLIIEKRAWQFLIVLLGLTGITGSYALLYILLLYSIVLFGYDYFVSLFWKFLDMMI